MTNELKNLSKSLSSAHILLHEVFGYTDFRPAQVEIITTLLQKRSVLRLMQINVYQINQDITIVILC